MPCWVRGVQPFKEHTTQSRPPRRHLSHFVDAVTQPADQRSGIDRALHCQLFNVGEDVFQGMGVLADQSHADQVPHNLVRRDRADTTHVLRDHQIRFQSPDGVSVDRVEGLPCRGRGPYGDLDAGAVCGFKPQSGPGHDRQRCGFRWVVAFMGHRDQALAKSEREQGLGCARQQ